MGDEGRRGDHLEANREIHHSNSDKRSRWSAPLVAVEVLKSGHILGRVGR